MFLIKRFLFKQWKYVLGIVVAGLMFFAAKNSGRKDEKMDNLEDTLDRVKDRKDVEDRVDALTDDDVDRILRDNDWTRK